MPRKLHQDAERRATVEGVSLNTWLTSAVARELGPAVDDHESTRAGFQIGGCAAGPVLELRLERDSDDEVPERVRVDVLHLAHPRERADHADVDRDPADERRVRR